MSLSRRVLLKALTSSATAFPLRKILAMPAESRVIAPGPFQPTWDSLKHYQIPEWFRDAKFGIWAHWDAQCVPEAGDWYARQMYMQGNSQYDHHLKHYGHPSKTGFMEFDNLWKAEDWKPDQLMELYVNAGAKYFMSLANHHDNFDCYDSRYHNWNSMRIGPKRDIVGTWARAAREHGLRFGVSNHSAHAWHWLQTAYDYDPEGPLAGVRYDAFTLTKEDGKGKWWEGLDPQELYCGRSIVMPDGIRSIKEADAWHESHDRIWNEEPPLQNPAFAEKWFLRCQDLLDKYSPDLLYFDNYGLPMGQAGRDIVTHFYNSSVRRNGSVQAVVFAKNLKPEEQGTVVYDLERGRAKGILQDAWQTDTCIGDWHYDRALYERHGYKTARMVVQMLVDIVSKNGNLLLSIPLRGSGSIDEDEHRFLIDMAAWMRVHGEAIYATRPFFVEGEGMPDVQKSSDFNESGGRPYTAEDIRFTTKGDTLYAFVLGSPQKDTLTIKTLTRGRSEFPRPVARVEFLGQEGALTFVQDERGLTVRLPQRPPSDYPFCFRIR
jgi:alpha-L-fucosidase